MSVSSLIAFLIFLFSLIPKRWKGLVVLGLLVAVSGLIGMVFVAILSLAGQYDQQQADDVESVGNVAEDEVPSEYIPIYEEAGEAYDVPAPLLAAIHRVETVFSTMDDEAGLVSYAGAEGHMQFMPCTWVGWDHPSCSGLGAGDIPEDELTDLDAIDEYGGFAVDGSGNGEADPYDIEDAVHSAANYLAANGAADGNVEEAVFAYNGADWYVDDVMGYMDTYTDGDGGVEAVAGDIPDVVEVGEQWIGNSEYDFGGGRNEVEQAAGIFDCSSFVHWAFEEMGVQLGSLGSVTTDTLYEEGQSVDPDDMQPGDMVFFNTYKYNGHVGIYAGDGQFIGAQSSTGVAYESLEYGYWGQTFNGNVQRIG